MISCLVLANVHIYCIVTFYCLLPSFLQIHNSDLFSFPHFTFISGEEPYHGCTDIKPLLLLLAGLPRREARVGQSPIPMEYGQPLFVWLSRD